MTTSKRRPVLLGMSLSILVVYAIWSTALYFRDSKKFYEEFRDKAREGLIAEIQLATKLMRHGEFELLEERLQRDIDNAVITAYVIKKNGKIFSGIDRTEKIAQLPKSAPFEIMHIPDNYSWSIAKHGDYEVTILVFDSVSTYIGKHFRHMLPMLARDIAIVALMCAFILTYFLRDISQMLKAMGSTRKDRKYTHVAPRSEEGVIMMRGLNAMEHSMRVLKAENNILKNQVLSALNSELSSGKKPPYEFNCTLVRVDVNNFSYIFNHHPVEEFMSVVNHFFERVTEIVSRYQGFVYEFVGDEVIFYFKDDDHANSALTALSALRDISAVAVELDEEIKAKKGYEFHIKCSAAHGNLRFGPQVNGYSLAGAILIDTVRILSLIQDRNVNSIYFSDDINSRLRPLVSTIPQAQAILKGSSVVREIWSYESHQELYGIIETLTPETASALAYYRSDDHICSILQYLREHARTMEMRSFIAMCSELRNMNLTESSSRVVSQYKLLMKEMIRHCIGTVSHVDDEFRLSSTITLCNHIVDKTTFDKELKPYFNDCLKNKNRRVVANALDVFSHFQVSDDAGAIRELMSHKDNRVAANAIVREGMKALNKNVIKHLNRMLKATAPNFRASGFYVMGELALHHKNSNPVYYETNVNFHRLFSEIEFGLNDESEMVRRQSLIAARKIDDTKISKLVMDKYEKLEDQTRKTEVEQLFLEQQLGQLKVAA